MGDWGLVTAASAAAAATATAISAAAAVAATTTAAATTATTAAAATTVTTTTAAAAFFTRASNVDGKRAAFEGFAVELLDSGFCFRFGAHRHESKSAALGRELVLNQHDFADGSCLAKKVLQVGFSYRKGKVPYVKFVICHISNCNCLVFTRRFAKRCGDGPRSSVSSRH